MTWDVALVQFRRSFPQYRETAPGGRHLQKHSLAWRTFGIAIPIGMHCVLLHHLLSSDTKRASNCDSQGIP
jgi:hypothetical protein